MLPLYPGLEPAHLKEEKRHVLNSTQKLAFNNYQAFIGTAECTREVFKEVSGCGHMCGCHGDVRSLWQ